MRISGLVIPGVALAAFTLVAAGAAFAVQDTPSTSNGVETVCTGVGSAKDDPRWKAYPVKVVLATAGGADLAGANIALTQNGKPVVQTVCDAPWVLFKPQAGKYTVTATLVGGSGQSHSANFFTNGNGPQKELTLTFSRPPQTPAPAGQ